MYDIYTVIDILKRFYNVNTIEELVLAQDEHITRLQQEELMLEKDSNVHRH